MHQGMLSGRIDLSSCDAATREATTTVLLDRRVFELDARTFRFRNRNAPVELHTGRATCGDHRIYAHRCSSVFAATSRMTSNKKSTSHRRSR
jgi:hypothetical protein